MLEKEKTNKILSPCLLYTGAVVCSLIFSSIFSQRMKTPAYIINDVISSLEEINKKNREKHNDHSQRHLTSGN